jgi:hypothetical protein
MISVVVLVAVVVAVVVSTVVIFIPLMIVAVLPATVLPISSDISSAVVVRVDPIGAGERRARPVAIVPLVLFALRVPIALDPDVVRTGPRWDAVGAGSWRPADRDAE